MPPTPKWPARTVFPQVWDENALDYTPQTIGTASGPASAVSVTNFPATQAVSGPLTDAQLRATPVPVEASLDTTPTYDSGLVALPDTLTALTSSTIRARGVLLCNRTAAAKTSTITNTAGDHYLKDYPLQANMTQYVPLGDATMVGVKWQASVAASVNAQLVGDL